MKKTIILVIFLSFLIGLTYILFSPNNKISNAKQFIFLKSLIQSKNISPTPTPKPTPAPIKKDANLEEEVNKLTPKDYSEDFNTLRKEVN